MGQKDSRGENLMPKQILENILNEKFSLMDQKSNLEIEIKSQKRLRQVKIADLLIWKKNG